ncbi:protein AHNAK2 isoform X2 [Hemicordylus capensis]|nr:protein AHNAK2 isoform X2 [Hemicordylus capensis]XP_053115574.1 protein AHNAK2 isoform X2 [Hemicordylus capensis]
MENRQRRDSSIKMSDSQESMEVTLQTEVESGASGFSVSGGGTEGIFVKQVLKESPASKLFSLREGDQLLSATIFFENIKYEDALKILQYSEPYKVQFNLKRKLAGKELETIHSATQSKKEKLSQEKEILEISEKTITEEDKANLIVKQRVGRPKRPKKDRLSWPKFQSLKGKKILGHRRSRSTSDAYEHAIPDVSPTSTDTESQFLPEEIQGKIKKGSQKKLKFPSIGFKMNRTKQEPEDRMKYEVKTLADYENNKTKEIPENNTVESSITWSQEKQRVGYEDEKKDIGEPKYELAYHTTKCPEVELTIKKPKEKKVKSKAITSKPECPIITSQQTTNILEKDEMKVSPTKQISQQFPKIRRKKQKGSKEKIHTKIDDELEQQEEQKKLEIKDPIIQTENKKQGEEYVTVPGPGAIMVTGEASLELKAPELQFDVPSAEIALDGADSKFKMPKLQMPKFGISQPKGKASGREEITLPWVEAEVSKPELKAQVTIPSVSSETVPAADIQAPSIEVEVGEKGKMPSVKLPKMKTPQVGVTLPKVEADISLPKAEAQLPAGEVSVKVPDAEGSVEGGGMKIHMPKFKMPSMGFSKPDIKGPKVDVDVSLPKADVTLPTCDVSISKPELKTGHLAADISVSAPEVKVPKGDIALELKAPEVDIETPSAEIALDGADSKFKMPKFQMPKFGISHSKGKAAVGEITLPSVATDFLKTDLKAEVTVPSVAIKTDIKVPEVDIPAPSVDIEGGEKGKYKMPDVKMPGVKLPKMKTPQVGVTLPKVEADISLPKAEAQLPAGDLSVKVPDAEGSVEGGGMKIHMPKFKMPSMGFSKPDIKGPKVDVDVSLPKADVTLPTCDVSISKPELKTGHLAADISVSAPEVKVPKGDIALELKAPEVDIETPSAEIALDGADSKFKMPKFQMPKFGISHSKGKAAVGEITLPSVETDIPKTDLKAEVTVPSVAIKTDIKVPEVDIQAPSVDIEEGEKGKFKMPDVKMPGVKLPKMKTPQVGVILPKVEADISLPKAEAQLPAGEVSVKVPDAEGSVEGGGMKMHMPKFKMPSMGFSKPDIKGPKVDVDVSLPKADITLPTCDVSISKPELKTGHLAADISVSAREVKVPKGDIALELKAPEVDIETPYAEIAMDGADSKFKMPKFQMPKFGISHPKGKAAVGGEITLPSVETDFPKTDLKAEVTVPSVAMKTDIKVPEVDIQAPSVDVEVGEKGKIKMPDVKMPGVKLPKMKTPQVGVTLPKVEADISHPKAEAQLPAGEVSVKVPDAEGSVEGGGMKMHMPKFKMPSMGFSKPDIKGPKVDVDVSLPKADVTLPSYDVSISKPELKTGHLAADISVSAPEVKVPKGDIALELKAPEVDIETPSAEIALDGADSKFKMPKFQMPKFGISHPKGKAAVGGEITLPSVETDFPKTDLKAEVTVPSVAIKTDIKVPEVDIQAPSVDVEVGEKGKFKMPDVKMPGVKLPKMKTPQVGVTLPKVEADISLPKAEAQLPAGEVSVKVPDAEGSVEGGGMKIHMPKFKMPSMGFSKPDIKGPKVDVDVSLPKADVTLPTCDVSISKHELKTGHLAADISVSAPEVKVPKGDIALELKAPEVDIETPSAEIALDGADSKFKMPKFQMPKFGISHPKGKAAVGGKITLPSVETDFPKTDLKAEVTVPSVAIKTDIKVPEVDIQAPSVDVEVGKKGKFKMPDVKMPGVTLPKMKTPQVGVTLPKVEADISLPKAEAQLPAGEVSVKVPDAEGSVEGGGMKMHMPKFKMPSMGFSKPDIKGPKVDVDVSLPKADITLPSCDVSISKPELKTGHLAADISVSAPEVKVPKGDIALELKAPEVDIETPSAEIALDGADSKFKMPKFQMPKFGISHPKGKAAVGGEITLPSVETDFPKTDLKAEVTVPSVAIKTDIKVPEVDIQAPSVDVEVGEKGKIKMPDVKMPGVKLPKMKTPQVGVTLPKVESDISLPKAEAQLPAGEVSVKVPDAEGSVEGGGMKIHMPKFKMPSMGFSKPDIKGPKVDVDVSLPKADVTLPSCDVSISKPELKTGHLAADISVSAPEVKVPKGDIALELKAPEVDIETPSAEIALDGADSKFKMPKFQMPKFGISHPKGKAAVGGEITLPSVETDFPKTDLKAEVTVPSVAIKTDIKVPEVDIQAPSVDVEVGEKGKIKMPDVKMPGVTLPKMKTPQVGVTLPKVEADISLPKAEAQLPAGEVSVKVPDAEGSVEGGGMKIHMPKFKMPSMGFSKPDIKGPKVDVDVSLPKADVTLPSCDVSISKPELKTGHLAADISVSAPEVKVPKGDIALELKAPEVDIETPSAEIALDGADSKFKMPKFQMPKFGISHPKGKAAVGGEITLPSVETDFPKTDLKAEVTVPSVAIKTDIKVPEVDIQAPSVDVEVGEKGKIKMPDVKMPGVKLPKMKTPQVGVTLPKVEADISLPKAEAQLPAGEVSVKVPDAEGSVEGGGMKMHMPKFKMPSMGFSKPDIKGPKVDVDVSLPKADVTLPSCDVSISKPELKTGHLAADISVSAPEVKVPKGDIALELKAPEVDIETPSAEIALDGADSKFKMPKFQMPKFGISHPKGKAAVGGEITLPSVETDFPKTDLKAEVTVPSVAIKTDIKVPEVDIQAPSVDVEVGEKGKIKMPDVKMPGVKLPKMKTPQVGVTLPKVEADISLPKSEAQLPAGEVSVKVPDAEGSVEGGGMKMHMPKFKMPSMGFSKPDIKGPKVDVDVSLPKADVTLPSCDVSISKPELKTGHLAADISVSAPEVKVPKGDIALELKAPEVDIETPSAEIALDGADSKFKMPKFQMPKFGISHPKGKAAVRGEITLPSVETDFPKTDLKAEVTVPSVAIKTDIKVPEVDIQAPSVDVEVGEKGKIKMPDVKMPGVKLPKMKTPQVGVTLPKVEADISLPKAEAQLPAGEVSVKVPDAEGSVEGGGMKIHMPKFKMPSMGFSKPDIKGPKVDVDVSLPKADVTLPSCDVSFSKPELKTGHLAADISVSAPEVKVPKGDIALELKAPEVDIETPSAEIALDGADSKFKMPKFQMPKFGISHPKGKAAVGGEITLPSVETDFPKTDLKAEVTVPSVAIKTDIKVPEVDIQAPSVDVEVGEKGKFKMPDVKMPGVKLPKMKTPQVGVTLPKVEADISLPKAEAQLPAGEVSVQVPDAEGSVEGGGMKIHMPKFKMPSMGFSKPDIKGPKVDVDVSLPKADVTLPTCDVSISKPELKTGHLAADISVSAPEVKVPKGDIALELKAPEVDIETPSAEIALDGADSKFKMPKFQMPKFGISHPKGKAAVGGEITLPSVETDFPKTDLKAEVTVPSVAIKTDIKVPEVDIQAPSVDVEVGEKGKFKMPDVKMPGVKLPKMKTPQVGVTLPKVEADISLLKAEAQLPAGKVSIKVPDAEGSVAGGGMKIHMPQFKVPSMGFSKPDIKDSKVDVDVSLPKADVTLSSCDVSISKPELKTGHLASDISISAPEVKVPTGGTSLELKAPEVDIETPSAEIALDGADSKFKMPKFQMPKFGISHPKGKAAVGGEITLPSVETDFPKTDLKAEVTVPSVAIKTDIKVPEVDIQAPSVDVEVGEKGKIKMPDVKMPGVKLPKMKTPQVGVTLPKVEADIALPKAEAQLPAGEVSVKVPDAEGSVEGGGMKIHMPKFKMPSMGFSKPDIKGPKVDVDVSLPKADVTLPSCDVSISKPELKTGHLAADISVSAPEVKLPTGDASLELKAPEVDIETPSAEIVLDGAESKFKMPKFQMPKFGISHPKGKAAVGGETTLPSVETDFPKTDLKAEVTIPSVAIKTDIKVPEVDIQEPSMEVGMDGKIKMPDVKMPGVKLPKMKTPQVGVTLLKAEADISLPKAEAQLPAGEVSVKVPDSEGILESDRMKIHMPKFKMPSIGFSKPDIKGPKVDVDVSLPKGDVTLPSCDIGISKPELKTGQLAADLSLSAPQVRVPTGEASLELSVADMYIEAPSTDTALDGDGVDGKFKMPKFQMPKFGVSHPKGKATVGAEVTLPSVVAELPKTDVKAEVTIPSVAIKTDIKVPPVNIQTPSMDVVVGEKGKIKMPDVKMPSVKMPKMKTPQVGVTLPKVEADISLPKVEAELPVGEFSIKVPDAEGSLEGGGMNIHMPKFKMPSMGFSKPDIKDPKVDVDVSLPKSDVTLPTCDVSISKPELKMGELAADLSISPPDVKISMAEVSFELKDPDMQVQAPSTDIALDGADGKFKKPRFQMPKFGISLPKGKAAVGGEITLPSVEAELPKTDPKAEVTIPSVAIKTDIKVPTVDLQAPSVEVEVGEKGKIKMPDVKMPSVQMPTMKTPLVDVTLPKVEADISLPKADPELPAGDFSVKVPDAEGSVEGGRMKIHMPKFKMPSMGFSKPDIKGPKVDMDISLPTQSTDQVTIQSPEIESEVILDDTVFNATEMNVDGSKGRIKMPKFQMPKFGLSRPKDKVSESKISKFKVEIDIPDMNNDVQVLDIRKSEDPDVETGASGLKMEIPSMKVLQIPKSDVKTSELDVGLPSGHISVDESEVSFEGPDLENKDIQIEGCEKESKFKMPKFKLPSFNWSPKKEASVPGDIDQNLKETFSTISAAEIESELTLTVEEVENQILELDCHMALDSEKTKTKRPQFSMPKISLPKMKGRKGEISLPQLDDDITVSKSEGEGEISLQISEKEISGGDSRKGLKMSKVQLPSLELSKPEIKAPKLDMEISLPKSDAQLGTLDVSLSKPEPGDTGPGINIPVAEIKVPISDELKDPETGLEGPPTQIAVDGAEIKIESVEGKMKRPKFQMPRFGISFSKGKVPSSETSLPSMEADAPQLKATTDIADIAVEAPTVEAKCDTAGIEKAVLDGKIKMPHIPRVGIRVPPVGLPVAQTDADTQASDDIPKEAKLEGDAKTESLDAEEKDGHFKMPKFKLPSFSWSPKKETSLKTEIKEPLKEPISLSDDTDAELTVVLSEDKGAEMDLDAEISAKKGQVKKPHFVMPKISLPKPKLPKSQGSLSKVEADITVERDGALVQIPDIESSFAKREEGTEISIKMPKGLSKPEIKSPQTEIDINLSRADIKVPPTDCSFELKSSEVGFEGPFDEIGMDSASMEDDGKEGKIRMPKLQMPKFGISVPERKLPESEVTLPKMEAEYSLLQVTPEFERLGGEAPTLEVKADTIDAEIKVSTGKIKIPQMPKADIKDSSVPVCSPDEEDIEVQGELETKPGEIQTEESQGWFKMPKFRMPSFGRSSSKGKKGDVEVESSTGKVPVAEVQVEIKAPEILTQSVHTDAESYSGNDILEGKVKFPQVEIGDGDVSLQKEKVSDIGLSVSEGGLLQSSGKSDSKLGALGTKTYADIVKHSAEGLHLQMHKPSFTVPASEISVQKLDVDINVPKADITHPKCDVTLQQHQAKLDISAAETIKAKGSEAEAAPTEITVGGTEGEIGVVVVTKVKVTSPDAVAKTEKIESQTKSPKRDTQGKESIFKMPKFSVPSFGWSSTKSTSNVAEVISSLEEPDVAHSEIKMDASVIDEDFEIIEFPVEGYEKDTSAESEVKVEERDGSSKPKSSKFKMPKFGSLRTKSKGSDIHAEPPEVESEVSLAKTKGDILEVQKAEGTVDLKSTKLDLMGKPVDMIDHQSEESEPIFHMPKLKMPKFTHSTSTDEGHILTSDATAVKCAAIDIDGEPKLELRSTFLEDEGEPTGYSIQKSTVRITTLSQPAIQRTHVESKLPSTGSSFSETTVRMQRPIEFSAGFQQKICTMDDNIQKSIAKITTLTEPDIKTTLEIKLPPADVVFPSASKHVQGPHVESTETKLQAGESAFGYGYTESPETFPSETVRESEIAPSEIKTATYGFSLFKVKIQESRVNVDIPVKLSSTEYRNEMFEDKDQQLKTSGESSGEATQKTDSAELKLSHKDQDVTDGTTEGASSTTTVTKVKEFTVEVQSSSEFDKQPKEVEPEDFEDTDVVSAEEDPTDQKEKSESKRSSGRFKFWFPNIGFSSSVDESSTDSKDEVQKSFPEETQPDEPSTSEGDAAKQTEKTGWFRFPKLGFSSPTKKSKEADKEETDSKERKPEDEESPTEKSETFFDAQETLPPKETTADKGETSGTTPLEAIVSSSARTELILLEKGKAVPQSIPEESPK